MRQSKLVGTLVAALLALAALALASVAPAEITLWKWLPGAAGEHFSGKTGKFTIQETKEEGGLGTALTCKESKLFEKESELVSPATGATLALAILELSGCKAFGVAMQSLGDPSGIVLMHLELHNCIISGGSGDGVIVEPLPVHLDVPATGLLIDIAGRYIVEAKSAEARAKSWQLAIEQKEGKQALKECTGAGETYTLTSNTDNNGAKKAGEEAREASIAFAKNAQEAML